MDWIRLGNSGVDLTGVGGVPRIVTLSELANHNKQTDAWIAIRGVYLCTFYCLVIRRKTSLLSTIVYVCNYAVFDMSSCFIIYIV